MAYKHGTYAHIVGGGVGGGKGNAFQRKKGIASAYRGQSWLGSSVLGKMTLGKG